MTAAASPLVVEGLGKRFEKTVALEGLTFEVRPAELFGLVGPDGAGKTTLFRILTTLLLPDSGSATWCATSGRSVPGWATCRGAFRSTPI